VRNISCKRVCLAHRNGSESDVVPAKAVAWVVGGRRPDGAKGTLDILHPRLRIQTLIRRATGTDSSIRQPIVQRQEDMVAIGAVRHKIEHAEVNTHVGKVCRQQTVRRRLTGRPWKSPLLRARIVVAAIVSYSEVQLAGLKNSADYVYCAA